VIAALAFVAACRSPPERPNLLLVDVDTLRADRLDRTRDGLPLMPNVQALAARGTRFDTMIAQSGWTLPALEALLTGRPPVGALAEGDAKRVAWMAPDRTFPEVLSLYGYETVVFYGPTLANGLAMFRRGFEEIDQMEVGQTTRSRDFVQWLEARPREPWFAFVHDMDLHQMPAFARTDRDRFAPGHPEPCIEMVRDDPDYTQAVAAWAEVLGLDAARDLAIAHYDGVVARADAEVGRMVEALRAGRYDQRTVVVFFSNHGEELFEHGELTHAKPYEFGLRVPLVIVDPRAPQTPRVSVMVQTMDLAPTLLELAGIPLDRTMEGQSLVPLLRGAGGYEERAVVSVSSGTRLSVRTPARHLLRCAVAGCGRPPSRGLPTRVHELYDPVGDPSELHDLSDVETGTVGALATVLDEFLARSKERPSDAPSAVPESFVEALRERGYWTGE
jgi:arylsulfatase A-like enzyme